VKRFCFRLFSFSLGPALLDEIGGGALHNKSQGERYRPIVIKTNIGLGTLEIPGNIETQWERRKKNKSTTATKNNGLNIKATTQRKELLRIGNIEIPPLGESDTIQ
jgi:hypothetical protein